MEKVLSIIIPTYNMEKYIGKCLESLIVDNMDLLEVLVINDGSKDQSSEIAHKFETKYPKTFKVIDKENGNYGSCINRGLEEATGKYIKILDADDSFYTENLYNYINNLKEIDVDLIITDFISVDEFDNELNKSNYKLPVSKILDLSKAFKEKNMNFLISMHAITYKRQNILDINYKQTEGISYTDMEWVYTPMTTVKKGIYYNLPLYKYLLGRPGQTMDASIRKKQIPQLMKMSISLSQRYETNTNEDYEHYLKFIVISQLSQIYKQGLIDEYYDIELLRNFDNELKSISPDLYNTISNIEKCKIKYINYWRKHQMKLLPKYMKFYFKIKNAITHFL